MLICDYIFFSSLCSKLVHYECRVEWLIEDLIWFHNKNLANLNANNYAKREN